MSVASFTFLLFFMVSMLVYLKIPYRFQWGFLLLVSIIFYFLAAPFYTFLYLMISSASVFLCTHLWKGKSQKSKRTMLILTIVINLEILALLKYSNLAFSTIGFFFGLAGKEWEMPHLGIAVPLGISFYTLQLISFLLDCYWERIRPPDNYLKLLLFTCYFPQILSGPISRYEDLGRSLFEEHRFDYMRVTNGLIRIAWGFFEKRVISDRLAVYVDLINSGDTGKMGLFATISYLIYPLQVYTDFCGCIDIVSGVSECFGIVLPVNFKAPFFSKSIREFWQRFHMTLGQWLKENIMYPILKSDRFVRMGDDLKKRYGKKKGKTIVTNIAMLIVWLCMGVWHGSGWQFILGEGLWFWFVIVIEQLTGPSAEKLYSKLNRNAVNVFKIVRTYLFYAIGMISFNAGSLSNTFIRIVNLFKPSDSTYIRELMSSGPDNMQIHILILVLSIIILTVVDKMIYDEIKIRERLRRSSITIRWLCYWTLLIMIFLSLNISTQVFVYSQF